MKKEVLYFTIDVELDSTGESITGNKTINVYEIKDNTPLSLFVLLNVIILIVL